MKRNIAINKYIHSLEDYEVYNILDAINDYDNAFFKDYVWFPMEEFDQRTAHLSHTELMRSEGYHFSICDTWFQFNNGELESADTNYIWELALDAVPELVVYCIHQTTGHTGDATLDKLINAWNDEEFDADYNPL